MYLYWATTSAGMPCGSEGGGVARAAPDVGGWRGGVAGRAFSLSVACEACESWLEGFAPWFEFVLDMLEVAQFALATGEGDRGSGGARMGLGKSL